MKRLNIGCGVDIRKGFVNLDKYKYSGVDVVFDLDKIPNKRLPFKNSEFDYILAHDILEHLENVTDIINELARVLKKDGILRIRVPHFNFRNAYVDITHKRAFSAFTFDNFISSSREQDALYGFRNFRYVKKRFIEFERRPGFFWNYLIEPIVNIGAFTQNFYERTPLRVFPCCNVIVELVR